MPNILDKFKQIQEERYKDKIKKHPYPTKAKFHLGSFADAINGFIWTLKTQPNFAVEILLIVFIFYLSIILYYLGIKVELLEVVIITVISALVLIMELFNTSIEALSDEVANGQYKEFIRISKDTSAAAVLVSSFFWLVTIVIIFAPKVLAALALFW